MQTSKIGIIGAGNVGAAIVNALVLKNVGKEIVLFNRKKERAICEVMDIDDTVPLLSEMELKATNDYNDLSGCAVIVITIGAKQKDGETRIDLLNKNATIIKDTIKELDKVAPDSIIMIVSNPVDILTKVAMEVSKRDEKLIFGSGTVLDTSRLRYQIGKELDINRKNVHIQVVGEHGDSEFAIWSNANIGSIKLEDYPLPNNKSLDKIKNESMNIVRNRAYEIIKHKGYTNYGVAVAVMKLIQSILRDEKKIFSISHKVSKEYALNEDVVLSLPCIVGKNGVIKPLVLSYNNEERQKLSSAAKKLYEAFVSIEKNIAD